MCEYIVQHAAAQKLASCFPKEQVARFEVLGVSANSSNAADHRHNERDDLIQPGMQVTGIRRRGTTLECLPLRWGWSPFWSSGTLTPLTHLPLHLVMRSKVFNRVRRDGRMLVAVEGWYEPLETGGYARTSNGNRRVRLPCTVRLSSGSWSTCLHRSGPWFQVIQRTGDGHKRVGSVRAVDR